MPESPAMARQVAVGLVAVALVSVWLAMPPMGTDLSAQVARADFFAEHGWAPIDFRWYGGVAPHGYSLVSPPLMAWFGPRPVGAAAVVVSAWALVALLLRTGARRPLLGGLLGAGCLAGNLVSGRITFAVGVALGLLALLVLVAGSPAGRPDRSRPALSPARLLAVAGLAAAAAAASPVAGLFVGLAGAALLLSGWLPEPTRPGRGGGAVRDPAAAAGGMVLMSAAAVPLAVMAGLFGAGGWMNMSGTDLWQAAGASLLVAGLVPHRAVRTGALLSAAGVVAAYLVPTPVGLNATRLAATFALPLVAAYATPPPVLRRWLHRWPDWRLTGRRPVVWLAPALVAVVLWQPPVVYRDLATVGDPTASPDYYVSLRDELARREPAGRVEVVPTTNYWESAYLDDIPLARGWLRQADLGRHPLFFDGTLDAESYRRWLADNGVSYVALSQAPVSWVGQQEAELIAQGLPYLTPVWDDDDWVLYEVSTAATILEGPAVLREKTAGAVMFAATEPGEVLLRVRWSRQLAVTGPAGACLAPAGEWTTVQVDEPGEYEVTGAFAAPGPRC